MQDFSTSTAWTQWNAGAAYLAIGGVVVSGVALLLLHVLSREFEPSWRMVSEYANGSHRWLLTVMFFAWAASSFALLSALLPIANSGVGKVGLALLALAGIGQLMGGMFDINHKLHGPAAMIGVPALCVAALVVTFALARRADIAAPPYWSAHLPWISFALMIGAMILFMTSLKAAGITVSSETGPLSELPDGVNGYIGWANRFLFLTSYLWVALASAAVIRASHE